MNNRARIDAMSLFLVAGMVAGCGGATNGARSSGGDVSGGSQGSAAPRLAMTTEIPAKITTPDRVKTRLGTTGLVRARAAAGMVRGERRRPEPQSGVLDRWVRRR